MLLQLRTEPFEVRAVHHEHPMRAGRGMGAYVRFEVFVKLKRERLVRLAVRALDVAVDVSKPYATALG